MISVTDELADSAISRFADGYPAVLLADRGTHAASVELIIAGQNATTSALAFMVRYGSGLIKVAMTDDDADRLDLPTMYLPGTRNRDGRDTVAVDAREGVTTGISAADRARTIRVLANPDALPCDLTRPGHVIPTRVARRGTGTTSLPAAALKIANTAGLHPVVAMCALVSDTSPSDMASLADAERFADLHAIPCFYTSHLRGNFQRC